MESEKIKTNGVSDVIAVTQKIGDTMATKFEDSNDLKVAQISLSAYKTAIGAAKAQVIYKKLTGNPSRVKFFED